MSAETTEVEVALLEMGAIQLDVVSSNLDAVRKTLADALAAEGQSWGADKPGTTHASGYDEQSQSNLDATEIKVDNMIKHVEKIKNAAKTFAETEESTRQGLTWKA